MPSRHPTTALLLLGLLLGACVAADPDAPTPGPGTPDASNLTPGEGSAPGASPTISLTPRAGATPADPAEARKFESEGELQKALEAFLSIAGSSGAEKALGVHGAARVLLQMERPAEARTLLESFLQGAAPAEAAPAHYLLARAYTALSMYNEALAQYDLYIQSGRPAVPYANLDRARILMDFGSPVQAANEAQVGLNSGLPTASRRTFTFITAQAYEKAGAAAEALTWYQRLFDTSPGDQPFALQRMAAIKESQGNPDYVNDLVRIMAQYPTTSLALETLQQLDTRGIAVDPYIRGLVYYRQNDYTKAEGPLRERINAQPEAASSAEAYYFLAAIVESRGQFAEAQDLYAKVVALNPQSSLADDALWWRGRLLEDEGRRNEAQALYNLIVTGYPASSWASHAAFRRGMLSYGAENYREAANIWAEGLDAVSDTMERQRLTFWQGKALLQAGDKASGEPLLRNLSTGGEDDYYGVRALHALNDEHEHPKAVRDDGADLTPSFDWAAAEAWLTSRTGRTVTPPQSQAWWTDARWLRAQELWLVGRVGQANTEAFDLLDAYAQDPIAMYSMARWLWDQGHYSLSGRAGQRLMRVLNTNPNAGLPKALLSLSYPAPFAASIEKYAKAEGISPLLMLAFIRQESFFDPSAESPANAYGLTQVLPATANSVAQRLGIAQPEAAQLLQADLNLRLGSNYMARQLDEFDDNIFVAFAAYNAGPNAARRWLDGAEDDADLYLETVEFAETRLYIEIVAENYAIYRYIYGDSRAPDLPDGD